MNIIKSLAYGITLFALMFLIGSIMIYGMNLGEAKAEIPMYLSLAAVLVILVLQHKVSGAGDGLKLGIAWLVVYALLDFFLIVQSYNKGNLAYYSSWGVYLYYAIILLVPAAVGLIKKA